MRYMQVIEATSVDEARQAYLQLLGGKGVSLPSTWTVYVETVHRSEPVHGSWLCYVAEAMQRAA